MLEHKEHRDLQLLRRQLWNEHKATHGRYLRGFHGVELTLHHQHNRVQVNILCRQEVMDSLTCLTVQDFSSIYAEFFKGMCKRGHLDKMVDKHLSYSALTPPWLGMTSFLFMVRRGTYPFRSHVVLCRRRIRSVSPAKKFSAALF